MAASIVVFARAPAGGAAKTRLCPPLSPAQSSAVHRAMAAAVLARIEREFPRLRRVLAVTPDAHADDPRPTGWQAVGQGDGDLGARLRRRCAAEFEGGADAVLLLGTDSPDMPASHLHAALDLLAEADAALCPAGDGGYCLLAVTAAAVPAVFEGIDWGTGRVAAQTRARAAGAGLRLAETPPWYDVDRPADLVRLIEGLGGADDPALVELRRALLSAKLPLDARKQARRM